MVQSVSCSARVIYFVQFDECLTVSNCLIKDLDGLVFV